MQIQSPNLAGLIAVALRVGMAGLFLWTGIPKILAPQDFVTHVLDYNILSTSTAMAVAMTLPWLEVILGITLLLGHWLPGTWLLTCLLCGIFIVADISALSRGLAIECGCGLGADQIGPWTLVRSCFLLGVGILGFMIAFKAPRPIMSSSTDQPVTIPVEANAGAC